MAEEYGQGATLQRYNSDLSRYIDNIKDGREDLHDEIVQNEEEKRQIEEDI